jgi:sugar phosphate isomerase/epimerase
MFTKRDILKATVAAASATGTAAARGGRLLKIGLQLYTVRDLLKADFEGTLRKVALLGYREVEFAGILGSNLKRTRALLKSLEIAAPSLHIDYAELRDRPHAAFDTALALDARFVVCPWLDPPERGTSSDLARVCERLNSIGEMARHSGLTLAYHNHDVEFSNVCDAVRPYDLLLGRTDERFVKFELDVYWATMGGMDPAALLRAHPSRFRLVHLKDMAKNGSFTEIGNGTLHFGDIIDAALQSGVQHFFVEQDISPDPLASIKSSMTYLRQYR